MGGQEGDFGRRKGEPGKAVQAGKRGRELRSPRKSEDHSLDVIVISEGVRKNQKTSDKIGAVGISVHSSVTSGTLRTDLY